MERRRPLNILMEIKEDRLDNVYEVLYQDNYQDISFFCAPTVTIEEIMSALLSLYKLTKTNALPTKLMPSNPQSSPDKDCDLIQKLTPNEDYDLAQSYARID